MVVVVAVVCMLAPSVQSDLCTNLKQLAHRADVFWHIYHDNHGGLYMDIKFALRVIDAWRSAASKIISSRASSTASPAIHCSCGPVGDRPCFLAQGLEQGGQPPVHDLLQRALAPFLKDDMGARLEHPSHL